MDDIVSKYRAQFAKASEEALKHHNELKAQLQAQLAAFQALQAEVGGSENVDLQRLPIYFSPHPV